MTNIKDVDFWHLFEKERSWQLSRAIETPDGQIKEIKAKFGPQEEWPALEYDLLAPNTIYFPPDMSTRVGQHQALLISSNASMSTGGIHRYRPGAILLSENTKPINKIVRSIEGITPDADKWFKDRRRDLQLGVEEEFSFGQLEFSGVEFYASLRRTRVESSHNLDNRSSLEWQPSLCMGFTQPIQLEKAIQLFRILENLFNFIFLYSRHNRAFIINNTNGEAISVFQRPSLPELRPPEAQTIMPLFCCDDTVRDPDSLLSKWFGSYPRWRSIIETIIIVRLGYLTPSNRFILLVNALEMIYSELFDNKQDTKARDSHNQMVQKVLQCVETENQKKIVRKRLGSSRPNLADVLREIFVKQESHFSNQDPYTTYPNLNNEPMIQNVVRTRNYYIHGSRIKNPLPVYELGAINNSLLKYAVLSLLEELTGSSEGFSSIVEANSLKIYRDEYENLYF